MRLNRIYTPSSLVTGADIALTASGANHVARVLRSRVGDVIGIFDGEGHEFCAIIASIKGQQVVVNIGKHVETTNESPLRITLLQGVSRGERMDLVVQKATELGVASIVPVITDRSVVKLDRDQITKKQQHWLNIAIGACEQSGRARLPSVAAPISLSKYLESGNKKAPQFEGHFERVIRLVLDPCASRSLSALAADKKSGNGEPPHFELHFELLIGPEGGLDDDEVAAANRAGFASVSLGPRILRTETAAIAALSVLQAKWGDLL